MKCFHFKRLGQLGYMYHSHQNGLSAIASMTANTATHPPTTTDEGHKHCTNNGVDSISPWIGKLYIHLIAGSVCCKIRRSMMKCPQSRQTAEHIKDSQQPGPQTQRYIFPLAVGPQMGCSH